MAETQTLNFGPEWLRALSGGGHGGGSSSSIATSPPLSPALPKYKLADYRYGREEMLALYVKDREIPVDLHDKDFLPILQEEPLPPLALVAFTEEEQKFLHVCKQCSGAQADGKRSGSSGARGTEGSKYFTGQRGDRRFEKPGRKESVRANYEEVGTGMGGLPVRKHDFTRSESENWRTSRDEVNGEDGDEGGWRLAGAPRRDSDRWCPPSPDGPRSAGRREAHPGEQPRQRRFPFDAREDERGYRRPRSGSGSLEEDGAPKEPILEEAELDFRPLEECDEGLEEDRQPRETKDSDGEARREPDRKQDVGRGVEEAPPAPSTPEPQPPAPRLPPSQPDRAEEPERPLERPPAPEHRPEANKVPLHVPMSMPMSNTMLESLPIPHTAAHTLTVSPVSAPSSTIQMQQKPLDVPVAMPATLPFSASLMAQSTSIMAPNIMAPSTPIGRPTEAEKMVAYLQDSDDRLAAKSSVHKPAGLPLTHEAALKWFYKDPQGEMQGPFSNPEMTEWFQAGYFTMTLLVKRGCDEVFQPLGEIIKITSESLLPPVTRSMSVPDSQGSVWEMQNPSSQASCTPNIQQPAPSAWEGSSVWDLPIDSMAQAPTIEQMQQLEKNKAAKLERREAELRAKREEEEEEEERKRLEEALRARQEEERKRVEDELARHKQEEERRKQEELEALRRREEEKRLEEEEAAVALARQQQEEAKRREQEAVRQQELARQRQQQQEALRRLQQQQQQQQLAQMKLPSSSKWGQQSAVTAAAISQSQNALSLAEIQKVEEERERQAREEQRRQLAEHLKLQQQQALQESLQPQAKLSGWGSVAKQPATTKSLLEIQREEAQQVKQRKEQGGGGQQPSHPTVTQQNRAQNRAATALSSSVWGSVATSSVGGGAPNWGGESSSIWGDSTNSNMGFWDEAAQPPPQAPPPARKPSAQKNNKANANLSRANKKVEEEEKLLKLFQGVNKSQQDGFMQWCEQTLHTLNTANNLDVPTFASFLKEVDSPYEVHDYVRAYLGDTSEAKEFAKHFLERRAKQKVNQQKEPQVPQNQQPTLKQRPQQQDSVWSGTGSQSLYQSNHTSLQQQSRFETVTSGKKKKKQKMVRADPSLLGFSVNAASERFNMGEIETVEDF
ncbi:unnamed protein product [Coregonus sp. 'balchen']|nr:unnamed protein product [Coregonus sp. 'balchen']